MRSAGHRDSAQPIWVERLTLADFRNHASASLDATPGPVVLVGPNGAGKTNVLEALSLLAPGQGLRRAATVDFARSGGGGVWAVAARTWGRDGLVEIGTGVTEAQVRESRARLSRAVKIDGAARGGSGALGDHVEVVWLTPAMDGLFCGPAAERRHFLDRLVCCFDPLHRSRLNVFERAMKSRNRLLREGVAVGARFTGLEIVMAESGVAIAAARREAVAAVEAAIDVRRARDRNSPFPWALLAAEGALESELAISPAVDAEESYLRTLRERRERDRAARRALDGPHRSDFAVRHGPKDRAAGDCSSGEQKALLLGVLLAHAELIGSRHRGRLPILLLDEVAAHLDDARRSALFAEVVRLGAQTWMTGTDAEVFRPLFPRADVWRVDCGGPRRAT